MTKTKTTPTHKIDLTIHFDRENATSNSIPNKLAQIKDYLSINAPLYHNHILFAGGYDCIFSAATGSRFVIYTDEAKHEVITAYLYKVCNGLSSYIANGSGIPIEM